LHGFPDHPPTALPFFEQLGRRVLAPWLRGYAPSPLAGPFDLEQLAGDVIELVDAIGAPIDLVGHDWGAAITYAVCARAPDRVRRAVTLALPHPRTFMRALRRPAQLRRSWYMAVFQLPLADRLPLIDRLWRAWSPGFSLDADRRHALHACLDASMPAPIRYYRDNLRLTVGHITTPLLQLHGAEDGCVLPPTDADARLFHERVLEIVPGVGHFLHLEDPQGIARRIVRWLA
jgi:pimeloyl-ACP methyl ester carboxylesterase